MRAGRLWGSGRAATGARQPHQLQVSLDFKAGPANDVHVCRPRGVVVAQREPEDPLLGVIVEGLEEGQAVVGWSQVRGL